MSARENTRHALTTLMAGPTETITREQMSAMVSAARARLRIVAYEDRAEAVLQQGSGAHPSNPHLSLALADVLAQRAQWSRAIEIWQRVPEELRAAVDA